MRQFGIRDGLASAWNHSGWRAAASVAALAAYPVVFLALYARVGSAVFMVGILPAALVAAMFGIRGGVLAVLVLVLMDRWLALHVNIEPDPGRAAALLTMVSKLVVALVVGAMRRLWLELRSANRALAEQMSLRERVSSELKHNLELHHSLVESMGEGVGLFDGEDCFVFANAAAGGIFGLDPSRLFGRRLTEFVQAGSIEALEQAGLRRSASPMTFELAVRSEGAGPRHLLVTESVLDSSSPKSVLRVMRDVTERQRLQQQQNALAEHMQRAQAMQSLAVLAGGVAHDFNNLLTGVLGNAELALLQLRRGVPEDVRHSIEEIQEFSREAAALSKQMLSFAGKGTLVTEVLDVSDIVSDALRLLQTTVAARAKLEQRHLPEPPRIRCDKTQLRQVVVNLVMNALEAMGDARGTIEISTGSERLLARSSVCFPNSMALPPGDYAVLTVRDSGSGMPQETLDHVFEPFFSTKGTGRGMGLAATLGIVHAHGGTLTVESTPGLGSRFTVVLPAAHEPASKRTVQRVLANPGEGHGKVLVVDDQRAVRSTVSRMLRELGYEAVVVESAVEGAHRLTAGGPAIRLVILDLTMPALGGKDALSALRETRVPVPVLLTSGYHEGEVSTLLREPGVVGFLPKPLQIESLERALCHALVPTDSREVSQCVGPGA